MNAVFFDRDGTIIHDTHYLHKVEDVVFFEDTFEALKLIDKKGYQKFIVTNQSGVGRGYFPLEDVHRVHQYIQQRIAAVGIKPFLDIAICPGKPSDNSPRRKPSPLMIQELAKKWKINLENSFMVGDKESDAQAGLKAGCEAGLVYQDHPDYKAYLNLLTFAQKLPHL